VEDVKWRWEAHKSAMWMTVMKHRILAYKNS
jgi:hypothetical protein